MIAFLSAKMNNPNPHHHKIALNTTPLPSSSNSSSSNNLLVPSPEDIKPLLRSRSHQRLSVDNNTDEDLDSLARHQFAIKFFRERSSLSGRGEDGGGVSVLDGKTLSKFLKQNGILSDDVRFTGLYSMLLDEDGQFLKEIQLNQFLDLVLKSGQGVFLEKAFNQGLIAPEFNNFAATLKEIIEKVKDNFDYSAAKNASYIPLLEKVDPTLFGMSICTVDGQRWNWGDWKVPFCIQSCIKPIIYGMTLEEHGEEIVHKHIGKEPSGVAFNSLSLNPKNQPHNALVNSGAIMACALLTLSNDPAASAAQDQDYAQCFENVVKKCKDLSGGNEWGFSNQIFLSEKAHADANFCLAYMMRGRGILPKNISIPGTLDFYFQNCSLTTNCSNLAIAGATIANGGICPMTGKKVFKHSTCRNILSQMNSSGMYDYSGEFNFSIGIPAKSGVSGAIYVVIPEFACISVYSPPLDSIGNSCRGLEVFKQIVKMFNFHAFDSSINCPREDGGGGLKLNPRRKAKEDERLSKIAALYSAAEGDLNELRRLITSGISCNVCDYDKRTLLHLSVSEGHIHVVKYLLKQPGIDVEVVDRWNNTPFADAEDFPAIQQLLIDKTLTSPSVSSPS